MLPPRRFPLAAFLLALAAGSARAADVVEVTADPPAVRLRGLHSRYSLLITGRTAAGRLVDRTTAARFRSADPRVARVSPAGVVVPAGDGATTVLAEADGRTLAVPVTVEGTAVPRRFHFVNDVEPVLGRFGCNSSGCHGKAEGQNGFKLSVFGFDPAADHAALTEEARGRRVFPAAPEQSLLLRKASGRVAHGGGVRIPAGSPDYETLRGWVAAGSPFGPPSEPGVESVRVEPHERVLEAGGRQRLRVVARYADGREADVTAHAKFQSNAEAVAAVQADGLVRAGDVPGEAAVMVSFMNAVDAFRALVPRPGPAEDYPALPQINFIDRLAFARLRRLNVRPSGPADDAEYLRRVYLDVIGTLPAPAEARRFLADRDPAKRARLVDELLARPEFADFWALQWADVLRVDRAALGPKRAHAYYKWLREGFAANAPFDRLARALVTAEGPLDEGGPAAFYKAVPKAGQAAGTLAQAFLGVRIACAECHHHPFDRWGQADYFGMSAFFAGVRVQNTPGGEAVLADGPAAAQDPRTGQTVPAHPLGEKVPTSPTTGDRRPALADWLTRPDNPWFARNLANRVWAHFLGRGLVEPVDDVRATNPPTNPELLDALARYVIETKYDVRALVRLIAASQVYQLSSAPNATNERDEQNYSRARLKRLPAEVLLDMVAQTTGVPERFGGVPPGTRAIQLWDSKVRHYFLRVFGRPERVTACACERQNEPSVAQVLHLLNAPEVQARLGHEGGTVARLVEREPADGPLVEELYLTFYSRPPSEKERSAALAYLAEAKGQRRQAAEDLAWGMLNSLEFVFNH
jgi:hypothetical protein